MLSTMKPRPFTTLAIATLVALAMAPGVAGAEEPHTPLPLEDVPSFNESPGCGALDGIRGPTAEDPGRIELWEPIYGPWADFFGRTMQAAWDQRVAVRLPYMSPGSKWLLIHERVLPAFEQVVDNLVAEYTVNGNRYTVYDNYTWSWSSYTIPPKRHFSFHAVGAAIDVNSNRNPYRADNQLITNIPDWFAQAWRDAGWCWGGDWQSIKDPMHFAWKGPLFTPGYEMPPPQPPLVAAANFTAQVSLTSGLPDRTGYSHLVADVDRDGAVDLVRIHPFADGRVAVATAAARYAFARPQVLAVTASPPADPYAPAALADLTRDGRPDLVWFADEGGALAFEIFAWEQSGVLAPSTLATEVPFAPEAVLLFDDLNRDGFTDLFRVVPGSPARLTVWPGPDFAAATVDVELPAGVAESRLGLGDRDVDGIPDLYAVDGAGVLTVLDGASGFVDAASLHTGAAGSEQLSVEDLDGDGHSDFLLVGPTGSMRLLRGGASSHDPGVWYVVEEIDVGGSLGCVRSPFSAGETGVAYGLVDPVTGVWCLRGDAGEMRSFYYGNPGDYPFLGDWDCDGVDTPGLYRQSDGYVYLRNANSEGIADIRFFFGDPQDVPLAGDFDGDGCDTVSIWRPSEARVYVINELGSGDQGLGAADYAFYYGTHGDLPIVGDFDGDGVDTIALFRRSDATVYLRNSNSAGTADLAFPFGVSGDRLVAADWNGDGADSVAAFHPATESLQVRYTNSAGVSDFVIRAGEADWIPVAGSYR